MQENTILQQEEKPSVQQQQSQCISLENVLGDELEDKSGSELGDKTSKYPDGKLGNAFASNDRYFPEDKAKSNESFVNPVISMPLDHSCSGNELEDKSGSELGNANAIEERIGGRLGNELGGKLGGELGDERAPALLHPEHTILFLRGIQKNLFFLAVEMCLAQNTLNTGPILSTTITAKLACSRESLKTSIKRLIQKRLVSRGCGKTSRGGFFVLVVSQAILYAALKVKESGNVLGDKLGNELGGVFNKLCQIKSK